MDTPSDSMQEITNLLKRLTIQRTSVVQDVEYHCEICKVSFNEEILLKCHQALLHEDGTRRLDSDEVGRQVMETVQEWFNRLFVQHKR